jgi:hypothetical protein
MPRHEPNERLATARRVLALAEQAVAERAAAIERGDKLRTWQLRNAARNLKEAKDAMMTLEKPTAAPAPTPAPAPAVEPPHTGWLLVSRKKFTAAGQVFNRGAVVPLESLGANYRALISSDYVEWLPPHQAAGRVQPQAAPAPSPPRKAMQVTIIRDPGGDVIKTWKLSVAETMRLSDCDIEVARCLLWATDQGSKIFLQATRAMAEANAISNRTPNRRIAAAI